MSRTVVLGIGNRLGADDAAGPCVVDILNQRGKKAKVGAPTEITAIDAGTAPESYSSVIRQHRPDLLILVDAADMGLPPGTLRTIPPEKISTVSCSTHHMPLSMFMSYVAESCGKIVLVGVQSEGTDVGRYVSEAVRESAKELARVILEGRVAEIPLLSQRS